MEFQTERAEKLKARLSTSDRHPGTSVTFLESLMRSLLWCDSCNTGTPYYYYYYYYFYYYRALHQHTMMIYQCLLLLDLLGLFGLRSVIDVARIMQSCNISVNCWLLDDQLENVLAEESVKLMQLARTAKLRSERVRRKAGDQFIEHVVRFQRLLDCTVLINYLESILVASARLTLIIIIIIIIMINYVWPETWLSPTPWLSRTFKPHHHSLAPPLRAQQTGRSSNTSRWLTQTRSFLWHLKQRIQRALLFSFNLVDASQLVLAICEKLLSYFNACQ